MNDGEKLAAVLAEVRRLRAEYEDDRTHYLDCENYEYSSRAAEAVGALDRLLKFSE